MAVRGIKTGSTQREFAAAPTPLRIADLDADLDAIFSSIDKTNFAAAPALPTNFLAQDGGIQTGHIAALAITTALLALQAVTTAILADLGVTTGKLAVGAPTPQVLAVTPTQLIATVAETTYATFAAVAVRNAASRLRFSGHAPIAHTAGGFSDQVNIRLKKDGVQVGIWSVFVGRVAGDIIPIPQPSFILTPGDILAHTYTWTIESAAGSGNNTSIATALGQLTCEEMA